MKIAIYARVSTSEQDVQNQLVELRRYCKNRNFEVFKEYSDVGESGSKENRPEFDRLMQDAQKRLFDAVLVWKLDRFSRSLKHLLNALDSLKSLNIDFICYDQNIDTTSPTGKLLFQIIGAFAEFERDLIRDRVKCGLERAKQKGVRLGRPKLEVNTYRVRQLRGSGMSLREIGKELGVSYGSVRRILRK